MVNLASAAASASEEAPPTSLAGLDLQDLLTVSSGNNNFEAEHQQGPSAGAHDPVMGSCAKEVLMAPSPKARRRSGSGSPVNILDMATREIRLSSPVQQQQQEEDSSKVRLWISTFKRDDDVCASKRKY